ncbi:hypothetical protein P4594_23275 [Priestia megaterium]|uniref:hypothetical protein n=1 Tax=Priestia megaterium TaxID=1404 RepID=UPI002E1BC910|nr:hypothetical protein [Priestia megaterium]
MDCLKEKVQEKLLQINKISFDDLDLKTKERLMEVERFIQEREKEAEELIRRIQELKITKTSITNSNSTHFTRKTLYNDLILNEYVNYSIEKSEGYFNEGKIKRLQQQINDIKNQYNKVLSHITKSTVLELQVEKLKEELEYMLSKNDKLHELIVEKDVTIRVLKEKTRSDNISRLQKKK